MSQACSESCEVGIGVILSPGLVEIVEEGDGGGVVEPEHRPEESARTVGMEASSPCDAAQASQRCAAQQSHEQGFKLVVAVMGDDDGIARRLACQLVERGVAMVSGGGFEVLAHHREVEVCPVTWDVEGSGEGLDESGVGFRFIAVGMGWLAQVVLDVSDGEVQPPASSGCEDGERSQECDGIGAAADADHQVLAGLHAAAVSQGIGDGLDEWMIRWDHSDKPSGRTIRLCHDPRGDNGL